MFQINEKEGLIMKKKTITFAMALTFMSQFTLFPVHAENNMIYEAEDAAMTGTLENISESGTSGGKGSRKIF